MENTKHRLYMYIIIYLLGIIYIESGLISLISAIIGAILLYFAMLGVFDFVDKIKRYREEKKK